MTVRVTNKDIRKGVPYDAAQCPIAKALRRVFSHRRIVVGCEGEVYVGASNRPLRNFAVPKWVKTWVRDFDRGDTVMYPITFTLEPA